MSHQPLPRAWVDRIFARFIAAFGIVRLAAMWPEDQHDEVKAAWAEQLGRFAPETIRAALQATIDSGREWPPTLPEFVEQCRRSALGRYSSATALAGPAPDRAAADALVQAAAAQHPEATHCCWAYRVGYPERPLEHSSDAGEPSGTAGRPILAAIAQGLSRLLADTYTLYLKTHNYHWNVTGPMFNTLHQMFELQYNELALAVEHLNEARLARQRRSHDFDRQKLLQGIQIAATKRPISRETIEGIVNHIQEQALNSGKMEIPSTVIGQLVLDQLATIDQVANIRFASVYLNLHDLAEVRSEIDRLMGRPATAEAA